MCVCVCAGTPPSRKVTCFPPLVSLVRRTQAISFHTTSKRKRLRARFNFVWYSYFSVVKQPKNRKSNAMEKNNNSITFAAVRRSFWSSTTILGQFLFCFSRRDSTQYCFFLCCRYPGRVPKGLSFICVSHGWNVSAPCGSLHSLCCLDCSIPVQGFVW
jgi:hypothetical protein